ncbi:hypothetical protein HMPREF0322_03877 [Desulfitobacterium hafniense DP7]|nr:AAA family ATPase [Desulfitobacterium hafniense]EHL05447.1 hypothetical protein HMPREF0322_03877 [Desulfitobacterium hafniense DP7]KTE89082.1 hypothetical protein AT727_13735 [Desulfitobacterium hafniense]
MADTVKQLRIFIASPGDCKLEREAVRRICKEDQTILAICRANRISLDVYGWEEICSNVGRPQSIINAAVEKFDPDWFVFILSHRFGSDAGLGMTGTEEEWNLARQLNEKGGGHPRVSIFFNQKSVLPHEQDSYQIEALQRFRDTIFKEYQALAGSFDGTKDFEKKFQAYLTEILLNLDREHQDITIDRLKHELLAASNVLLDYQRTLADRQQIERSEFTELLQRIEESEHSTTLVLGSPGSGKSSLLSTLVHHLKEKGISLLSIKADVLGTYINTADDLRKALNLSLDIRDAVAALAEKEKVVVIFDQLDAIAELLDIKSGRLNVLLNLIHNLSGQKGVHIIASSREFEYRHDVRLNSINADKIALELPVWEKITPVLEQAGHETNSMSDALKELLRTPLHLKVFLDVAKPGAVFHSLHALLEKLWEQRVLAPYVPQDSHLLLTDLAKRMAEEESLWLPLACADGHPEGRRFLEQNDILVRGQDNLTIGFRHQTYYDYTLTRVFAGGSISLADYVFQRQDGLFIRPTFLSCLQYLRTASPAEYHRQLKIFFETGLRPHLFSLLLEFLGSQKNPDDMEAYLMLPLLNSDTEGPKVLGAVVGSPGWFNRLYGYEGLDRWMNKVVESASLCVPLLTSAAGFAGMDVIDLIKKYWFGDTTYDHLTLSVFLEFKDWDSQSVRLAEKLVSRNDLWIVGTFVEKIAEVNPELASRVLLARLDGKLAKVVQEIEAKEEAETEFQEDEQYSMNFQSKNEPLEKLLENRMDFINFDLMAEGAPEAFLQWIWPWFVDVVSRVSLEEHDFVLEYRSDTATFRGRLEREHEENIETGLLVAIKELAKNNIQAFLQFIHDNASTDLLGVHCLLAQGLEEITASEPQQVLAYLVGDPRRLYLGDYDDFHKYTKRLITDVFPHLNQADRLRLEAAVLAFDHYKRVVPEWDANDRRKRLIWSRQHRLRLLRAFPEEYLSLKTRQIKAEEERAFPKLTDYDSKILADWIGPRINADEMTKASDDELINLFNQLPDETQWDNPRRRTEDSSRGGGAVQQSREFKELAKNTPYRAVGMIPNFEPGRHESYAGAGLEGLAESDLPLADIIRLVEYLDRKGFSSEKFREGAASALEKLAGRENGLPDGILTLLEKWLAEYPEPYWPDQNECQEKNKEEIKGSILSGRGLFYLPHGRGTILRAILAGYLKRRPSDCNNWARVIRSRLGKEPHPAVWALTMMHMPVLFNGDPEGATQIYDAVIQTCPQVLEKQFTIYSIARVMRRCQPIEILQKWLEKIIRCPSELNHQAYGEMLFLYHYYYQDSWSTDRIIRFLLETDNENVLLGLAYGASHLWSNLKDKTMARDILCCLASHNDKSIQHAVTDVFRHNSDHFQLNEDIKKVILAVCTNNSVLIGAATDLIELLNDYTGIEPEFVSKVCQELIRVGGVDIGNIRTSMALLAEPLTNITLTLHRHSEYREIGLQMFEELISLNIRETRAALDILDRNPTKPSTTPLWRRRRRKR